MKLTSHNGLTITVDPQRIVAMGDHAESGSFINVNSGPTIRVVETMDEIKALIKNDRKST